MFRLDPEVLSFLDKIKLAKFAPIFRKEELSMNDVLKLSKDDLKEIGIDKFKDRKLIFDEIEKLTSATLSTMSSRSERTLQTTSVAPHLTRRGPGS